ncbi:cell division protein FtsZ [candidate division KSB1 bacterium]|nr:cell division protein FtsZ [candidate division KSB1 bacterium]MBL7092937.1 cell division protein FtsZ [candidate division KSB1 bacterium]
MSDLKSNLNQHKLKTTDEELEELLNIHRTKIQVIGTGGAGNNTITRLADAGIEGIETIAINTDAQDLLHTKADGKLIIGKNVTKGLGAGGDPQIGEQAAKESEEEIKSLLQGNDMVFISCGLGGGTGTGAAPVIAEIARNLNVLTVSVVTMPFSDEGTLKEKNATSGLERLRKNSDTIIVIHNDRLLDMVPDLPVSAAFKFTDEVLVNAVRSVTGLVANKGLINLDFADIKTVMKDGEIAMIGIGESDSNEKVQEAIEKATHNQLLNIDIAGAQKTLINIEGDESMSMGEAQKIMVSIAEKLDSNAKILWGTSINKDMKGKIKIFVIATGLNSQQQLADKSPESETTENELKIAEKNKETYKSTVGDKNKNMKNSAKNGSMGAPAKNVFNQIFEDEIKGDLNILKESIKFLEGNKVDNKTFRNLKNACKGLMSSAQLYSNKNFEEFVKFINDIFDQLIINKIKFSSQFLPLFNKIPPILEGMAAGFPVAVDDSHQIIKELSLLIDQGSHEVKMEKGKNQENKLVVDDEIFIEKMDLEKKLKMELN